MKKVYPNEKRGSTMKKHQQVIKILILTLFVISMLYLTLKDDLQDILQLLQNLDFYHSL